MKIAFNAAKKQLLEQDPATLGNILQQDATFRDIFRSRESWQDADQSTLATLAAIQVVLEKQAKNGADSIKFPHKYETLFELSILFQESIPKIRQKQLSAFYTQPSAAILLATLTIDHPRTTVADPACGTGTLLLAALKRKCELWKSIKESDELRPRLADLCGSEIDALAADFARWILNQPLPRRDQSVADIISGNSLCRFFPTHSPVDVVLMNPPFTRQERWTPEDREMIANLISQLDLGGYFQPQMSLSAIFILLADTIIENGGRMGLVVPATTFSSRYSACILQFLRDRQYAVNVLVEVLGENSAFSQNCHYKEYLLVLEKGAIKSNLACITTLTAPPLNREVNEIATVISRVKHKEESLPLTAIHYVGAIPRVELFALPNWEIAFKRIMAPALFSALDSLPELLPFGNQSFADRKSVV